MNVNDIAPGWCIRDGGTGIFKNNKKFKESGKSDVKSSLAMNAKSFHQQKMNESCYLWWKRKFNCGCIKNF